MAQKRKAASYSGIIRSISAPLGFYVLALLIIEATAGVVLTWSKLSEAHVWCGFICMLVLFGAVLAIVSILVIWPPKNLVYGKEEHLRPALEPSATRDQIEDLILKNVKAESLKSRE